MGRAIKPGSRQRGRQPDRQRRHLLAQLRALGLTYQQIGDCLGISHQSVQQTLQRTGNARLVPICCRKCSVRITSLRTVKDNNGPVYCLACLPAAATRGQRLKAHRLTKGLTLMALSQRTGIGWGLLSKYERDLVEPKWGTLVKLIRVLGTGLIAAE